jgi:pSer/pThr/pTyr-binding forkhead associated (FHA) protein
MIDAFKDRNMNVFKLKHVRTDRVFCINKSVATIGRDTTCDVVLPLGYPSRFHAKISDQDGGLVLEDLNSTNGTFVNDQRLSGPTIVKAGDVIKFSTEAYNLLDFGLHDKPIISGKLSSRSINNTDNKARPNINDTIVR